MQECAVASNVAQDAMESLRQFHLVTVAHPRLVAGRDQLMSAIFDTAPGSLILVIGPTGVGKTTLRLKAEQLIAQQMYFRGSSIETAKLSPLRSCPPSAHDGHWVT